MPDQTCDRCDNVVNHLAPEDGVHLCEFCVAVEVGREFEAREIALRALAAAVVDATAAGLRPSTISRVTVLALEHEDARTAIEAASALAGVPDLQSRLVKLAPKAA